MSEKLQTLREYIQERDIITDSDVRELFIPYLESLLVGTEYENKMKVISQHGEGDNENTIVVGVVAEKEMHNAYNGKAGIEIEPDKDTLYYVHDRDIDINIEITMSDNDALWMFAKYIMLCIQMDSALLTASGKLKLTQFPVNKGIMPRDMGERKIWVANINVPARIHNIATITAEIY